MQGFIKLTKAFAPLEDQVKVYARISNILAVDGPNSIGSITYTNVYLGSSGSVDVVESCEDILKLIETYEK